MLGKRFRRTTSMSQLGPGHNNTPVISSTSEEIQGMAQSPNTVASGPHHKAAKPLIIIHGENIVQGWSDDNARDGDANMGDVLYGGFDVAEGESHNQGRHIDVVYGGDMSMVGVVPGFDSSQAISDTIFTEGPFFKAHNPPLKVLSPPALVPFQMGLWTPHNIGSGPHVGHYSTGFGKLEHAAESIFPVDFLDVCYCCKRRLKHERDIFIYRGDTAFCSEECRHRQILSDERRSLRGSSKRGARATSSETAVAA